MGGAPIDPLRLAARLALARSLAPCGAVARRAQPDAEADEIARVNAAIRQLPETQREVFLAVRLHDRPLCEVADHMAMELPEAERTFAAALLTIMRALEGR